MFCYEVFLCLKYGTCSSYGISIRSMQYFLNVVVESCFSFVCIALFQSCVGVSSNLCFYLDVEVDTDFKLSQITLNLSFRSCCLFII